MIIISFCSTASKIVPSYMVDNLEIFLKYVIFFMCGYFFQYKDKWKTLIIIIWILVSLNAFLNININSLMIDRRNVTRSLMGVYLFLGDSYAIWAIVTISILKKDWQRFVIMMVSIIVLFILTSRASLYAFTFAVMLQLFFNIKKRYVIALLLLIIVFLLIIDENLRITILKSRHIRTFFDPVQTTSARNKVFIAGLEDILKFPFTGNYGGQILRFGTDGSYIHNCLSLWRQFGFVAFFLFFILCFQTISFAFKILLNYHLNPEPQANLFLLLSAMLILEVIFARSYNSPFIAIVFGLAISIQERGVIDYKNTQVTIIRRGCGFRRKKKIITIQKKARLFKDLI
ncbi:MAG: hypothetical protein JEZ04_10775 [Spirochaetales bacterium]|nr:hypothetical protein [Spirochaetales bacterium]